MLGTINEQWATLSQASTEACHDLLRAVTLAERGFGVPRPAWISCSHFRSPGTTAPLRTHSNSRISDGPRHSGSSWATRARSGRASSTGCARARAGSMRIIRSSATSLRSSRPSLEGSLRTGAPATPGCPAAARAPLRPRLSLAESAQRAPHIRTMDRPSRRGGDRHRRAFEAVLWAAQPMSGLRARLPAEVPACDGCDRVDTRGSPCRGAAPAVLALGAGRMSGRSRVPLQRRADRLPLHEGP